MDTSFLRSEVQAAVVSVPCFEGRRRDLTVEMKVRGAGGVGGYYRQAVGQAVLYWHWIHSAAALDPWFVHHGLNRTAARAAVVVPDLDAQPPWRARLQAISDLIAVELIEVPHQHAALR